MPAFIAMLLGGLIRISGTIAGRVLIALGIGFMTFTGIDSGITYATNFTASAIGGLGSDVAGFVKVLGVGEFLAILASAVLAKMTLRGLQSGAIRKVVGL